MCYLGNDSGASACYGQFSFRGRIIDFKCEWLFRSRLYMDELNIKYKRDITHICNA